MISRDQSPEYILGLQYIRDCQFGLCSLELSELLGISKRNVNQYIKLWRDAKLIYISGWQFNGRCGRPAACYSIRDSGQSNKRRPKPKTGAQKTAQYRRSKSLEKRCGSV